MSTPPPDAPGTPAAPGPPLAGPSAAKQVGSDAASIAKGAVLGGTTGAVKAALKTGTGKKLLIALPAIPLVAMAAVFGMVASATTATTNLTAGYTSMSQKTAAEDFADGDTLPAIQDAAVMTGVRWEVLAGIVKVQSSRSGDKGTGPFGIDVGATGGRISAEDAADLKKAARFMGAEFATASRGTVDTLNSPALDAGAEDIVQGGNTVRQLSSRSELKALQTQVEEQYTAAIVKLPLKGNPGIADSIFAHARNWSIGQRGNGACFGGTAVLGGQTTADLNAAQKQYAQEIINRVAVKGMPKRAAVVALMTAMQESTLRMYWNPKVPGSEALAPDKSARGVDGFSVGLFQQQVNGSAYSWGTVEDAMDPAKSSDMFLDRLAGIPEWMDLELTVAAQKVQVSAFPDAYAKWQTVAELLVNDLKPTGGGEYGEYGESPSGTPTDSPTSSPTSTPSTAPTAGAITVSTGCGASGTGSGTVGKGDDYPFRDPVGACAWCSNVDAGGPADPWSLYKRECVSFVAWRMNVQMGWKEGQEYPFTPAKLGVDLFGNAAEWKNTVGSKFKMDTTPKVGAIAWWKAYERNATNIVGAAGHVAVVSAVNPDGTVLIEEYNFTPWAYGSRTIPASDITGFIHVADIDPSSGSDAPSSSEDYSD
jgi:surface antigen